MKHEWKKAEKQIYLPKSKPEIIDIPTFQFITIEGEGNPNSDFFKECVGVLFAVSYVIKMGFKKGVQPKGYVDYTVYPLEGIWDINAEAKKHFAGTIDKNALVYKLMIRQPDFVDQEIFNQMFELTKKKKPHELLDNIKFEQISDGQCIQMMHLGSYDNEPKSFKLMEAYAETQNLLRISKVHREIYLSDARKVAPEKLKTVLRFQVKAN